MEIVVAIIAVFASGHAVGWRMGRLFEVYTRRNDD